MKGNLVKRTLSLLLAISVLFTMLLISTPSVSAETAPIFSEDFTTWTEQNFSEKLTAGGWSGENNGAALSAAANLKSGYNGHTTTGYSVDGNNILKAKIADTPISTGRYEVKIKLNPGANPNANIYIGGDPTFGGWNTITSEEYLIGMNFYWNGVYEADENGNKTTTKLSAGTVMVDTNALNRICHWKDLAGYYEHNKWYDISIKLDFDTRVVNMNIYDEGTENVIASRNYTMQDNAKLGTIMFTNQNNPFVIEKISVTPLAEHVTVIADEKIDNLNSYDDRSNNLYGVGTDSVVHSFWRPMRKASDADSSLRDLSGVAIDKTTFADTAHKSVFAFTGAAGDSQIHYDIINPIKKGKVKISWDVYQTTTTSKPFVVFTDGDTNGDDFQVLMSGQDGFYPFEMPGIYYPIQHMNVNQWYTITAVVDLDKALMDVAVSHEGKQLFEIVEQPLASAETRSALKQIDAIRIMDWGDTYYMDNFKVEVVPEEKEVVEYITIFEDDFQSYNGNVDSITKYGWGVNKVTAVNPASIESDGENYYLKLTGNCDDAGYVYKEFAHDKNTGKVRFTFDANVPNGKGVYSYNETGTFGSYGGTNPNMLAGIGASYITHSTHNIDDSAKALSEYTPGTWVRIQTVVDMSNRKTTYSVLDMDTNEVLKSYTLDKMVNHTGTTEITGGVKGFMFKNYGDEGTSIYLDNFKVEYGYPAPEISADKVAFADYSNAAVEGIVDITPGIKTITLDFGDNVTKESAAANITLTGVGTNQENETIAYTGVVDGSKYIMTLSKVLLPDATYVLSVGADVANARGITLGKDFEYNFTTGKASCTAQTDGVYTDSTKYTSVAEIKAAEVTEVTVKATAENMTRSNGPVSMIVVYFNNEQMVDTDIKEIEVASGEAKEIAETFTLPADMTDVTTIRVLLWNTVENLMPYCSVVELP